MYEPFDVEEQKAVNDNREANLLPYYQEYLDPHLRGTQMPFVIRLMRNRAIIALFVQVIASLTSFFFYTIRRLRVGQIVNILCLLLVYFAGKPGVLQLDKFKIAVHGVMTSSIFGVIFIYSLLEATMSGIDGDRMMLIIFCLPYLADFIAGVSMLMLSNALYFLEQQSEKKDIPIPELSDKEACVICASNKINTIFYSCGHKVACYPCSLEIKKNYKMECPLCRQNIKDIILVYEQ